MDIAFENSECFVWDLQPMPDSHTWKYWVTILWISGTKTSQVFVFSSLVLASQTSQMCFDLGKGPGGHVKEKIHRIPDKSRLAFRQFCACQEISEMSEREGTLRLHFYVSALFLCCFFCNRWQHFQCFEVHAPFKNISANLDRWDDMFNPQFDLCLLFSFSFFWDVCFEHSQQRLFSDTRLGHLHYGSWIQMFTVNKTRWICFGLAYAHEAGS